MIVFVRIAAIVVLQTVVTAMYMSLHFVYGLKIKTPLFSRTVGEYIKYLQSLCKLYMVLKKMWCGVLRLLFPTTAPLGNESKTAKLENNSLPKVPFCIRLEAQDSQHWLSHISVMNNESVQTILCSYEYVSPIYNVMLNHGRAGCIRTLVCVQVRFRTSRYLII